MDKYPLFFLSTVHTTVPQVSVYAAAIRPQIIENIYISDQ